MNRPNRHLEERKLLWEQAHFARIFPVRISTEETLVAETKKATWVASGKTETYIVAREDVEHDRATCDEAWGVAFKVVVKGNAKPVWKETTAGGRGYMPGCIVTVQLLGQSASKHNKRGVQVRFVIPETQLAKGFAFRF